MDLASHLGRFFHRTSPPTFYARFVAALLVLECLSLMVLVTEKKCKYIALIFGISVKITNARTVMIGVNVGSSGMMVSLL